MNHDVYMALLSRSIRYLDDHEHWWLRSVRCEQDPESPEETEA
jgi:hypothetical protein